MAGGDIQAIGSTQQPIRMCVCGRPVPPTLSGGRVTLGANESRSAVDAVEHVRHWKDRVEEDFKALVEGVVTPAELKDHIAALRVQLMESFPQSSVSPTASNPQTDAIRDLMEKVALIDNRVSAVEELQASAAKKPARVRRQLQSPGPDSPASADDLRPETGS